MHVKSEASGPYNVSQKGLILLSFPASSAKYFAPCSFLMLLMCYHHNTNNNSHTETLRRGLEPISPTPVKNISRVLNRTVDSRVILEIVMNYLVLCLQSDAKGENNQLYSSLKYYACRLST